MVECTLHSQPNHLVCTSRPQIVPRNPNVQEAALSDSNRSAIKSVLKGFTTAACLSIGICVWTQLAYEVFPLSTCFYHHLLETALVFHVFCQIGPRVKFNKGSWKGRRDVINNESWQNEGLIFDAQIDRVEPSTHNQRDESGNLETLPDFRDSRISPHSTPLTFPFLGQPPFSSM